MRKLSNWKAACAMLGLSLLMYSPAMAQTASGSARQGGATREQNQNNASGATRGGASSGTSSASGGAASGSAGRSSTGGRTGAGSQAGQTGQPARQGGAAAQGQQRTANRPVSGGSAAQSADHQIAGLLAIGNAEEIAMSRLALEQAQNDEVKQFAQMMIDEHSQVLQQLSQVAPEAAQLASSIEGGRQGAGQTTQTGRQGGSQSGAQASAGRSGSSSGNESGSAASGSAAGSTQTSATGGSLDMLAVHQQIAQQCLEQARNEFRDKQGAEFDMAYMGQQLVMHQQMIAKQTVLAQHASPELRQAIEESQQGAEKHLQHAKQLVRQLSPQAAREVRENRTGAATGESKRANRSNSGSSQQGSESRGTNGAGNR